MEVDGMLRICNRSEKLQPEIFELHRRWRHKTFNALSAENKPLPPAVLSPAGEASPPVNWVDPEGLVSGDPLVTSGYFDWIECLEWMDASEGKMLIGSLLTQKYRF
ncbi:hypothetical protein TNIN_319961 [Trichonephila inaurata madagascariensis]|uniref:Uncharacterized protein n=1 Tax=Trichonephila inaurata madagascariensis TaxID=2747483 RepID=A0A8X6YNZ2_9ARAC|nr:hypothetical protein TNIN_319961 [Trichonephila inaurata madagascariensis]